mgnify:CR=1 FL=1
MRRFNLSEWALANRPLVLFAMLTVAVMILIIIAAVRANEGKPYRYPMIWRPIK